MPFHSFNRTTPRTMVNPTCHRCLDLMPLRRLLAGRCDDQCLGLVYPEAEPWSVASHMEPLIALVTTVALVVIVVLVHYETLLHGYPEMIAREPA